MMKSDDLSLPALRKNPEKNHPKNTTHLEIPPHVEGSQGRKVVSWPQKVSVIGPLDLSGRVTSRDGQSNQNAVQPAPWPIQRQLYFNEFKQMEHTYGKSGKHTCFECVSNTCNRQLPSPRISHNEAWRSGFQENIHLLQMVAVVPLFSVSFIPRKKTPTNFQTNPTIEPISTIPWFSKPMCLSWVLPKHCTSGFSWRFIVMFFHLKKSKNKLFFK